MTIRRRRPVVTLYSRAGCHLCARAETGIRRLARWRATVHVVDVDTDSLLAARYGALVPVVEVDGLRVGELQIDLGDVRAAVRRGARRG